MDTARFINCAFLLGLNDNASNKPVDGINDFTASDCTITSAGPILILADPCGDVRMNNIKWLNPSDDTPCISFIGLCTIGYLEVDCRIYRTQNSVYSGPYLLATATNGAFNGNIGIGAPGAVTCTIKKMRVKGWEINDTPSSTSFLNARYVFDFTYITVNSLILDSINMDKTTAVLNPNVGGTGIGTLSGSGLVAMGFVVPSSIPVSNNCFFFNSSAQLSININGVTKVVSLA